MVKETSISKEEIVRLLQLRGDAQKSFHKKARDIRNDVVSNNVYFRGLIEFSNTCSNDCHYCGIRSSKKSVERYTLTKEEIMSCVKFCNDSKYASIVLQSGERLDDDFVDFVEDVVGEIQSKYPSMMITLCVGEQSYETYKRFFDAGAKRYLLRIESSVKEHYDKLHPKEMSYSNRVKCLKDLKEIGYQVGSGVMICSPYQKLEYLADDLLFLKENNIDMVGMGPFIPENESAFESADSSDWDDVLEISLNMVAVLRVLMPDINIAATTALQTLTPNGRELALDAGANVIMPLVTPKEYRKDYSLYAGKPCQNETSAECLKCITKRIESVGGVPAFGLTGNSKHFLNRGEKE